MGTTNNRLRIKLVGTKSNRDGIGATVRVTAGSDAQTKMLRSGSSYLSSSELVLTFGLGTHSQVDSVEIQWPSGAKESISKVSPNQFITIKEGSGIVSSHPLAFAKARIVSHHRSGKELLFAYGSLRISHIELAYRATSRQSSRISHQLQIYSSRSSLRYIFGWFQGLRTWLKRNHFGCGDLI